MSRVIAVLVATLLLLAVGFYVGRRPVGRLAGEVEELRTQSQVRIGQLEADAALAEARGYLWQTRAELLVAALDVERSNFGTASDRCRRAGKLLARAAGVAGLNLDLTEVQELLAGAVNKIDALDPGARAALEATATRLGQILERQQA